MSSSRCPSCHGSVRADASWCLQCHLDLRPKPEAVLAATVQPALSPGQAAPSRGRHPRPSGWPCAPCGTENDFGSTTCETCGSAFLVELQSDVIAPLRLPLIGDISSLRKGATYGISIGVGLLFALVLSGLLVLAGNVL